MTDKTTTLFLTRKAYAKLLPFHRRLGELYQEARRVWSVEGVTLTFSRQVDADLLTTELAATDVILDGTIEVIAQRCRRFVYRVAL